MSYPNQKTAVFLREHSLLISENSGNRVVLWRHGKTNHNDKSLICGSGIASFGIPLNDKGREETKRQVNSLRSILKGQTSVVIASSPQPRALETANILAGWTSNSILEKDFLREIDCGCFEGKPYSINPPAPDEYVTTQEGGDWYLPFCQVIHKGIKDLLTSCSSKTILISTHGTTGSIINQMFGNKYTSLGNVDLLEYDMNLKLKQHHKSQTQHHIS